MKRVVLLYFMMLTTGMCCAGSNALCGDTLVNGQHVLPEVTVTENRQQQALSSTSPLYIMNRSDLTNMGVTNMADAVRRLPGITLRDYGGAGGMKTVSVRGFGTKHTGVSYDGVMLSECQTGEIDLSRYSLNDVNHLSLIVGDGDDIFQPARNATTPSMLNIETLGGLTQELTPSSVAKLGGAMKMGSFGYASPFVRYEQPLGNSFVLTALGEYTYAENDYPYTIRNVSETVSDRRQNSRMNQGRGEFSFLWRMNRVSRLSGKLYYFDSDRQLPGIVHYYSNHSKETLRDRNAFGQLVYRTHWDGILSLKVIGKFNWAASYYDDGVKASQIQDADYFQREYYASGCLLYTPTAQWSFDYSADYAYNNLNSTLPRDVRPHRHAVLQSLTSKYDSQHLVVTARLLHSLYLNDVKEGESAHDVRRLSPSLSLSYGLADGLRVRASYKEIFRVPTFNESYFFHYGSTDLQPERTQQLNLGLTWHHVGSSQFQVQTSIDGYYNKVKDMIVSVPYNMFVWTCVNVGRVRTLGLDATLRASQPIADGYELTLAGNYTLQHVTNRTNPDSPNYGKQIAYMPEHSGGASLSWENPWVNLSINGIAVSQRWSTNGHLAGTSVDGYYDLGLTLWREWPLRRCRLETRLDLKNITDQQYEVVGAYPMPGIHYLFTIHIKH